MSHHGFGKVTMSTKEYRGMMDEIHKAKVETDEAKRGQYEYFKRADNAEKMVAYITQFIHSCPDVYEKFKEYESANTGVKN